MSKIMRFVSIFVLAVALLFPAILAEPALAESPEISKSSFSSIIEGTINSLPVLTQGPVGIVEIEDNLPIKEGNLNDISPYLPVRVNTGRYIEPQVHNLLLAANGVLQYLYLSA
ncbi:MAG TPA: hypothetical protein GXX58_03860 [Gelria sp.]|nr:hypothetical protein [Gelria sp.]